MKKEQKRYILAEHIGIDGVILNSIEEYQELLKKYKKLNNLKNSQYIYGNISCMFDDGLYYVTINKYHKLTPKMEITDLDNITSQFVNEDELREEYQEKITSDNNYLSIIYLETKNKSDKTEDDYDIGVRWIPIMYKDDEKFFDRNYMRNCIYYYADNKVCGFFLDLVNKFMEYRICEDDLINIRIRLNELRYLRNCTFDELSNRVNDFYNNFIVERNENGTKMLDENGNPVYSRRRQRDFIFFVKNYDSIKRNNPTYEYPDFEELSYIYKRQERENDLIEEERALDAWDKGLIYKRN